MMDSYDDLGMSWNGTGRLFKGVLLTPLHTSVSPHLALVQPPLKVRQ